MTDFLDGRVSCRDCGKVYGYYYQPERFENSATTWLRVDGYRYPLFADRNDAVRFVRLEGFPGRILRYAADQHLMTGRAKEYRFGSRVFYTPPYPWITAGQTDIIKV